MSAPLTAPPQQEYSSGPERLKAYTDAVVAIAQTLLILPLLESVPEAKTHHFTTTQWLEHNSDSLIWFLMSFSLIWSMWLIHHRLFDHVERISSRLQGANMAWMLGVVFFPVTTALMGASRIDTTQMTLYIGTLLFCSLSMNVMTWLIVHDPAARGDLPQLTARQVAASFTTTALYALVLLLALNIPGLNYLAFFAMFLMVPAIRLLTPEFRRRGWGE